MTAATNLQTLFAKTESILSIDLFKIGQAHNSQQILAGVKNAVPNDKFRIALDMEDCLDRFYGGYYSDWACGGQWNRAYQFVQLLANAFNSANIEIIAFFDGTLKSNRCLQSEQSEIRQKTLSVLKHIRIIGSPPPKIWWLPPSGIRTFLRNAMRSINIQVMQTVQDHTAEIIDYYHEFKLNAIMGLNSDYIFSNIPRYFSSHDLRLSYRGVLETKEYNITKLFTNLNITSNHIPYLGLFLGNDNLIDELTLKIIFQKLDIDSKLDVEIKIKRIIDIVDNIKYNIDDFIKKYNLSDYDIIIKEGIKKYQQRAKGKKHFFNLKKTDKSNLIKTITPTSGATDEGKASCNGSGDNKKENFKNNFVYTIPGEVIKTALNRHQRGIMDSRIYQLLIKKEIVLPHVLEDEHYKINSSINIFYRPARQMVYAILFNLYHQKYLCSKNNKNQKKNENFIPEVKIQEWVWKQQTEYKVPDIVQAVTLSWAVPTIQRLWFGTSLEDKQRRMKAFLTIMRSDSPLMLNRGYVPQHMLVMACVLRYMITSPDKNILTRPELDAFLATAFSPQLVHIEYTQNLTLPGVNLRGVYLASLFTQGIETASLANDVCGVPLPWMMTNPWLFFDGKLFHLKLKMSTYVQNLRELCDDHIEIVLKIERFRKAILEDVEHNLHSQSDIHYRQNFVHPMFNQTLNKVHPLQQSIPSGHFFDAQTSNYYYNNNGIARNLIGNNNRDKLQPRARNNNGGINQRGYQLKVGGIVVGSWADGAANKTMNQKKNSNTRYPVARGRNQSNLNGQITAHNNQSNVSRPNNNNNNNNRGTNGRGNFNKNRRNRKRFTSNQNDKKKNEKTVTKIAKSNTIIDEMTTTKKENNENNISLFDKTSTNQTELQNGTGTASALVNSICDEILNEDYNPIIDTVVEISNINTLSTINESDDSITFKTIQKNITSKQLPESLTLEECG